VDSGLLGGGTGVLEDFGGKIFRRNQDFDEYLWNEINLPRTSSVAALQIDFQAKRRSRFA